MANKEFTTRITMKYDSYANWIQNDPQLLEGELAVVYLPPRPAANNTTDQNKLSEATSSGILFKVGAFKLDSSGNKTTTLHKFSELPWASALAADVYAWAKEAGLPINIEKNENEEYDYISGLEWSNVDNELHVATGKFISEINDNTKDSLIAPTTKAVKDYVDDAIDGVVAQGTVVEAGAKIEVTHNSDNNTYTVAHQKLEDPMPPAQTNSRTYIADLSIDQYGHIKTYHYHTEEDQDLSNYKTKQTAVNDPEVDDEITATAFIDSITQNENGEITVTKKSITAKDLGLTGAMRFLGVTNTEIKHGDTIGPIKINDKDVTPIHGDVVLYNNKEFLANNDEFVELGDESSYALKTIQLQTGAGLTGGGTLEQNIEIGLDQGVVDILNNAVSKVVPAAAGNFASLDASGNLMDSGQNANSFVTNQNFYYFEAGLGNSTGDNFVGLTVNGRSQIVVTTQWDEVLPEDETKFAKIAATGNINDLKQTSGDYVIFNCGTSSTVI